MASSAYIEIESINSGSLTTGCNTALSMGNGYQLNHEDQITVLSYSHAVGYENQTQHSPIQIVKNIDKSSPVLAQACSDGDELKCTLQFYRPNSKGANELFYEIKLTGALIKQISTHMPHSIDFNVGEMQEVILISYRDISWHHVAANTSAYATWNQSDSDE